MWDRAGAEGELSWRQFVDNLMLCLGSGNPWFPQNHDTIFRVLGNFRNVAGVDLSQGKFRMLAVHFGRRLESTTNL